MKTLIIFILLAMPSAVWGNPLILLSGPGAAASGPLFGWDGTYNTATANTGETITVNGLTDGVNDGTNPPSTTYDAATDYMVTGALTWAGGIASAAGNPVLDMNQGTLLIRFATSNNTVTNQYFFGKYVNSTSPYFQVYYISSGRIYVVYQDGQGTPNQVSCYRTLTPTNDTHYNILIEWDLAVDNSTKISIDGDAYSCSGRAGTETSVVVGDFALTPLYLGSRTGGSNNFVGEISDVQISDVYGDALTPY